MVAAVPGLLSSPVPVVASIALKGRSLIAAIKAQPDVRLLHVGDDNRDSLSVDLARWLRELTLLPPR